jgi:hypothetical protein
VCSTGTARLPSHPPRMVIRVLSVAWNLCTLYSRSGNTRKLWNVVLEKDGEDHLDRSCRIRKAKWRKANWNCHISHRNCLLKHVTEGELEETGRRRRRCKQLLPDLKETKRYQQLKGETLDRTVWRTRFAWGYGPVVRQTAHWMMVFRNMTSPSLMDNCQKYIAL